MKSTPRAAITIVMAAASLSLAACGEALDARDEGARTRTGSFGALEFEAEPLAPPTEGPNAFRVAVRVIASGEPFASAALTASGVMPSMGHQAPDEVIASELSAGLYDITDLVFTMPGRWELRCRAEQGSVFDEAAFTYEVR
jgi:hypothetical protein